MTAPLDPSLHECELCSAKPGTPTLCATCLENRRAAGARWLEERRAARAEVERLKNGCAVHDGPTSIVHRHFHDAVVETLTKERDTAIAERDAAREAADGIGALVAGLEAELTATERVAEERRDRAKRAELECDNLRARVRELEKAPTAPEQSLLATVMGASARIDREWSADMKVALRQSDELAALRTQNEALIEDAALHSLNATTFYRLQSRIAELEANACDLECSHCREERAEKAIAK